MGSSLSGYQTMIPEKLTDKEKKELKFHLDELESLIRTPNFREEIAKEESSKDKWTKQLQALSPLAVHEMENLTFYDDEDYGKYIDFFQEILNIIPETRKFIDDTKVEANDVFERTYKILGRNFRSIFAGESSWGDEPEGSGYQTLKMLDIVGLLAKIEELTIPSANPSIHFIKENK